MWGPSLLPPAVADAEASAALAGGGLLQHLSYGCVCHNVCVEGVQKVCAGLCNPPSSCVGVSCVWCASISQQLMNCCMLWGVGNAIVSLCRCIAA